MRQKHRWKAQVHKREGELHGGVLLSSGPLRMAMSPKRIQWGENVRERKAMAKIAGSFNSFRNLAPLSANRVNETCNLVPSGGRQQALMVSALHGPIYGKRLPTYLSVKKREQLFYTINIEITVCQAVVQSTTLSVRIWNYKMTKIIPICHLLETNSSSEPHAPWYNPMPLLNLDFTSHYCN